MVTRKAFNQKSPMMALVVVLTTVQTAMAETWHVSTVVTDGMTGPQQITNALTRLVNGDTILVEPGTYDFTGIYMMDGSHLTRSADVVAAGPVKTFSIVGNTSGHWSDEIVFTGDKRFGSFEHQSGATGWRGPYPLFQNITFQGFTSSANHGGCLKFALWATMTANRCWPIVSNCVFRSCSVTGSDRRGGAIYGGVHAYDCKFVDNTATGFGGAISGGAAFDSTFDGNVSNYGGAMNLANDTTICADVSNCVFTANRATREGGALIGDGASLGRVVACSFSRNEAVQSGGACAFTSKGMPDFWNCAFTNNFHTSNTTGGGAVLCNCDYSETVGFHGCTFVGNSTPGNKSNGGAVKDGGFFEGCTFIGNTATNALGGALYFSKEGGLVSNCVFTANECVRASASIYPYGGAICATETRPVTVVDSAFTNNAGGWNAGGVTYGVLTRCRFKGNHSPASGGAIYGCTASQCSFDGDYAVYDYRDPAGIANSALFDCDVSAAIYNTAATRCRFHDVNFSSAFAVFYQKNWVTNSLVVCCGANLRGIAYSYNNKDVESEFVNCTFADNYAADNGGLFTAGNGRNPVKLVNCILAGNTNAYGVAQDVSGANVAADDVKLRNCMYGAAKSGFSWVDVESSCVQNANPGFVTPKQAEELKVPAYSLKNGAAARGLGLLLDWTEGDKDLALNPRVRDGKVDLGCYECWMPMKGFIISFK